MKKSYGFAVIESVVIIMIVIAIAVAALLVYRHHKNPAASDASNIPEIVFSFPTVPSTYHLVAQPDPNNGIPSKDYTTDDSASMVLAYAKSICAKNGFEAEEPSAGQVYIVGGSYEKTTLQCFAANAGWQFDIMPGWTLHNSSSTPSSTSVTTAVTIQSIGPPITNGH